MRLGLLAVSTVLGLVVTAQVEAAPDDPPEPEHRFSVSVAAGSHFKDGGDVQAVSFGYQRWRYITLVAGAERNHLPMKFESFSNGYSIERGGTLTTVSVEARYIPWQHKAVSPYVFAGLGVGTSRPTVNNLFPTSVTNSVASWFGGGGVRFMSPIGLGVFVDTKFLLWAGTEEIGGAVPVRAGVTWQF